MHSSCTLLRFCRGGALFFPDGSEVLSSGITGAGQGEGERSPGSTSEYIKLRSCRLCSVSWCFAAAACYFPASPVHSAVSREAPTCVQFVSSSDTGSPLSLLSMQTKLPSATAPAASVSPALWGRRSASSSCRSTLFNAYNTLQRPAAAALGAQHVSSSCSTRTW